MRARNARLLLLLLLAAGGAALLALSTRRPSQRSVADDPNGRVGVRETEHARLRGRGTPAVDTDAPQLEPLRVIEPGGSPASVVAVRCAPVRGTEDWVAASEYRPVAELPLESLAAACGDVLLHSRDGCRRLPARSLRGTIHLLRFAFVGVAVDPTSGVDGAVEIQLEHGTLHVPASSASIWVPVPPGPVGVSLWKGTARTPAYASECAVLAPGDRHLFRIGPPRTQALAIRSIDVRGQPLGGAEVGIQVAGSDGLLDGPSRHAQSGPDGYVRVDIPQGSIVRIESLVKVAGAQLRGWRQVVASETPSREVSIVLEPCRRVVIKLPESLAPSAEGHVRCWIDETRTSPYSLHEMIWSSGEFSLSTGNPATELWLPPGPYDLMAHGESVFVSTAAQKFDVSDEDVEMTVDCLPTRGVAVLDFPDPGSDARWVWGARAILERGEYSCSGPVEGGVATVPLPGVAFELGFSWRWGPLHGTAGSVTIGATGPPSDVLRGAATTCALRSPPQSALRARLAGAGGAVDLLFPAGATRAIACTPAARAERLLVNDGLETDASPTIAYPVLRTSDMLLFDVGHLVPPAQGQWMSWQWNVSVRNAAGLNGVIAVALESGKEIEVPFDADGVAAFVARSPPISVRVAALSTMAVVCDPIAAPRASASGATLRWEARIEPWQNWPEGAGDVARGVRDGHGADVLGRLIAAQAEGGEACRELTVWLTNMRGRVSGPWPACEILPVEVVLVADPQSPR